MKNKVQISFEKWKKRCNGTYINAICKPCWELKYCPYGVLVEDFELRDEPEDPYRCRIFGHICPVFLVAEPLTETKELRNISRQISMITQRRVSRRDNYVCQICHNPIPDEKINFDHIIPWSKGGSSDESNIRLLCERCNKARGNSFEEQYLVAHVHEVYHDPALISTDMVFDLLELFLVAIELNKQVGLEWKKKYCSVIKTDDVETDEFMYMLISQIWDIFHSKKFFIPVKKKEALLRYRWGLSDGDIHSIEDTCQKYKVYASYYVELEELLLRQIGFVLRGRAVEDTKYVEGCINNDDTKAAVTVKYLALAQEDEAIHK